MDFEDSPRLGTAIKVTGLPNAIAIVMGQSRKRSRRALETAFSQNNMRDLFPHMLSKAKLVRDQLLNDMRKQGGSSVSLTRDISALVTRYMVDLMGLCIFGVEYDSIRSGVPSEFERTVKKFYERRMDLTTYDNNSVSVPLVIISLNPVVRYTKLEGSNEWRLQGEI